MVVRLFNVEAAHSGSSGLLGEESIGRARRWGRVFSMSKRFQFGAAQERGVFG